jgi:hypothetical protein
MDNIINKLYTYDKNLFISQIYEPWILYLKKKANNKIKLLKYCYWCDTYFDYYAYGMCIDCTDSFQHSEILVAIQNG